MAIKYFCDKCQQEIPQDKIVSIMKLWKSSRYSMATQPNAKGVGQVGKVDSVEEDKKILCPKCADEVWGHIKK